MDEVRQGINQARELISPLPTPHACQTGVDEAMGDTAEAQGFDFGKEIMKECFDENTKKGKGNWLVALAQALGAKSGEHLKEMVKLGEQMGDMNSKKDPEKYAEVQAMFQAESKIFGMFQEAISTMLKSIGEGLSSVARKQ
jgi:hypothetical protein